MTVIFMFRKDTILMVVGNHAINVQLLFQHRRSFQHGSHVHAWDLPAYKAGTPASFVIISQMQSVYIMVQSVSETLSSISTYVATFAQHSRQCVYGNHNSRSVCVRARARVCVCVCVCGCVWCVCGSYCVVQSPALSTELNDAVWQHPCAKHRKHSAQVMGSLVQ